MIFHIILKVVPRETGTTEGNAAHGALKSIKSSVSIPPLSTNVSDYERADAMTSSLFLKKTKALRAEKNI